MTAMSKSVDLERRGRVAVLTVNNPPVNALSQHVRHGLAEGLKAAAADAGAKAIVIVCTGRTFIAGADITEFGKPPTEPSLHAVLDLIEGSPKPVVAAIHGTALGGGLEVTLACHYRVGAKGARFGLPEVKLGLLPGAGGTQLLPRTVGRSLAAEMILAGRVLTAGEALAHGIASRVVPGLRDQLHPGARGGGRSRDRRGEPIRLGFLDGSAQPQGSDDDDHAPKRSVQERSGRCGGVRGRAADRRRCPVAPNTAE
jgi:enoyl-CoA hydratase/carnithine racemase